MVTFLGGIAVAAFLVFIYTRVEANKNKPKGGSGGSQDGGDSEKK